MKIHQEKDHTEKCYEGGCPNVTHWKQCPVCKESQPTVDPANGLCQNGCVEMQTELAYDEKENS